MSNIIDISNRSAFQKEVIESTVPVLVDFWASWCGPCKVVPPKGQLIADAHGDELRVVKIDVDALSEVAEQFHIQRIPTIALFQSGEWVTATAGAQKARAIETALGLAQRT
jgi:thioredoxin 1